MATTKTQREAKKRAQALSDRYDAWVNLQTGLGSTRDKLTWGQFASSFEIDREQLRALFYGDDMAYRIISEVVNDATRPGYELEGEGAEDICDEIKRLKLDAKIKLARKWGRLYGGGAVILGIDDGQTVDKPVDPKRVRGIKYANVVTRDRCVAFKWYEDPLSDDYGTPKLFNVTRVGAQRGDPGSIVHADRMLRFFGTEVDEDERRNCQGWSHSVLFRCYAILRDFAMGFASAGQLLVDAGQAVFSMKGVFNAATMKEEGAGMRRRMADVDRRRSSGVAIILDIDREKFERAATPLAGIGEVLEHFEMRLAAAAEMPVTKLMKRSPQGMNATGQSDQDQWNAQCTSERNDHLTPAYDRLCTLLSAGEWEGCVKWRAFGEPSEKEQSETALNRARKYDIEIQRGMLQPAEATLMEYGDKSVDEVLDFDALEREIEAEKELADAAREAAATLTPEQHAAMAAGMKQPPQPPANPTGGPDAPMQKPASDPMMKADVSPAFKIGDRVEALVDHMTGMKGKTGTIAEVHAGSPPYYAVTFDGSTMPHKWLAENEVEAADDE